MLSHGISNTLLIFLLFVSLGNFGGDFVVFVCETCLFVSHLRVEKVPGVWIYASAWVSDHNLNDAAARALMQNGLPLRMELAYLNKLKAQTVAHGGEKENISLISVAKDGGSNAGFSLPSAAVDFIPHENPASKRDV
ncbi:hypothetical protein Peur_016722 [Populus x canadensis]